MSRVALNAVLVQAYEDGAFELPTGYEGKTFEPPAAGLHANLHLLGGASDQRGQTLDKHREIFQIDVRAPLNGDRRPQDEAVDAICKWFLPKRLFTHNGQAVTIQSRTPSGWRRDGVWGVVSITILFIAALERAAVTD
jgi:hypothetical protein